MDPANQRLETGYEPIHVDVWRPDLRLSDGAIYTKFFTDSLQPALNKVLAVFVPLVTTVASFIAKHPVLISQVTIATAVVLGFRTAILAGRLAMLAFSVAMNLTPFGWVRIAIMALVFAGTMLYQNWDKIKAYAIQVWPTIKEYGVKALDALKFVFMNFTPVGWLIQAFQAGADVLSNINWSDSGSKIIQTLIDGIKAKADLLVDEVKGVFARVREYLPFSDAKVGPFSELTRSGGAIMTTLAAGVQKSNHLQSAVNGQFNRVSLSRRFATTQEPRGFERTGQLGANNRTSPANGGNNFTYAPVINLPAGSPQQTHDAAQKALSGGHADFEKRMNSFNLQQRRLSYA